MVHWIWSSRAAANNIASASGPSGFAAPDKRTWRMISAPGEPPGLARELDADAERFQPLRQHRRLGRFAGALAAFEGDELSLHRMIPIAANLTSRIKAKPPANQRPKNTLGFKSLRLFIQRSREITDNDGRPSTFM